MDKDQDKAMLGAIALGLVFAYLIGTGLIELVKVFAAAFSG